MPHSLNERIYLPYGTYFNLYLNEPCLVIVKFYRLASNNNTPKSEKTVAVQIPLFHHQLYFCFLGNLSWSTLMLC